MHHLAQFIETNTPRCAMEYTKLTKSLFISATIILIGCQCCQAQSEITWLKGTVYDFGEICEDAGAVTHKFIFKNTGKEPFVVLGAVGRCGCTTATHPKQTITPGDTASVTVRFDPAHRKGFFKQRVTVLLSGPSRHNTLFVKGVILPSKKDSTFSL